MTPARNSRRPDDNSAYIPGVWVYRDSRFLWQPGYWAPNQQDRVWHPAQRVWTPNGWLFINGYWDLPYENRGLATPPVYFNQPLWNNPDWSYQPSYAINPNAFLDSAFTFGPGFYFGNYYNPRYRGLGFNPWFAGNRRYDPLFANYARRNPNFTVGRATQLYAGRSGGTLVAPPLTLAQQGILVRANNVAPVVAPFAQFNGGATRLVQASPAQIRTQQSFGQQTRQIASNRRALEMNRGSGQGQALRFANLTASPSHGIQIHNGISNAPSNGIKIVNETPRNNATYQNRTIQTPTNNIRPTTPIRPATNPVAPARSVTPVNRKVAAARGNPACHADQQRPPHRSLGAGTRGSPRPHREPRTRSKCGCKPRQRPSALNAIELHRLVRLCRFFCSRRIFSPIPSCRRARYQLHAWLPDPPSHVTLRAAD